MRKFEVYAPLSEFDWKGSDFELPPGLWVRRFNKRPDLRSLDSTLAEDEQDDLASVSHWLTFRWDEGTEPCPAEMVNMVLLALWLVKPTRTHVAFRFELETSPSVDGKSMSRLFDRFAWIEGATQDTMNDADLQVAASHYKVLRKLCCNRGRLNDAFVLTLTGCWSHNWQAALICHAAAAEAILTYSTAPGVTRRLATAYACLVETQVGDRDRAFREFIELYSVRSDVMHGRSQNVLQGNTLSKLARFNNVLRRLWCVVLSSPLLIDVLERTDGQRENHFLALQAGYTAPS